MHMSIAEIFAGKESSLQTCNYAKGRNQCEGKKPMRREETNAGKTQMTDLVKGYTC